MRRALAGLAILVLALAACGGSAKRLSKEEFISKAEAICARYQQELEGLDIPQVDPTSASTSDADVKTFGEKTIPEIVSLFRKQVKELRDLKPPADFQDAFSGAMDDLDSGLEILENDAVDAAKAADREALKKALDDSDALSNKANKVALDYGLKVCGS